MHKLSSDNLAKDRFVNIIFILTYFFIASFILPPHLAQAQSGDISQCSNGIDDDGDGLLDLDDLGCWGAADNTEGGIQYGIENGWTVLEKSADTKIVYVSSSQGSDANDGLSPLRPVQTINRARQLTRNGYPDWILFKRGDTWNVPDDYLQRVAGKSGRSPSERFVIASYGPGTARPIMNTGIGMAISIPEKNFALIGIEFIAGDRVYGSPTFKELGGTTGISVTGSKFRDILIEDCKVSFYPVNISVQKYPWSAETTPTNIFIRRNLITDAYANKKSSTSKTHSQGLYAKGPVNLVIEGNLFDHNGWNESFSDIHTAATLFNHNLYICAHGATVKDNLIFRASSIGVKIRGDYPGSCSDMTVADNLFVEGEIGVGASGNAACEDLNNNGTCSESDGDRIYQASYTHKNVTFRDNVLLGIGRTAPTGRGLSWGMGLLGADTGSVTGNYVLHASEYENTFGFRLNQYVSGNTAASRNVTIANNLIYNVHGRGLLFNTHNSLDFQNITISNNNIQQHAVDALLVEHSAQNTGLSYTGNNYFSSKGSSWFKYNGSSSHSFSDWKNYSGDSSAEAVSSEFPDPNRTVASYHAALGKEASFNAFIQEARKQSKGYWRDEYTASKVNYCIKAGFNLDGGDSACISDDDLPGGPGGIDQNPPSPPQKLQAVPMESAS